MYTDDPLGTRPAPDCRGNPRLGLVATDGALESPAAGWTGRRQFCADAGRHRSGGGIADVLVVGRPDDRALQAEVATLAGGVRFVDNHHADEGQISSIVAAVDVVDHPGVRGLLVVPVDQPLITAATVAALLAAFERKAPAVARATYQGRNGHPVLFAASLFGDLRRADRALGARAVVRGHADETVQVEVPDANVLVDIDDPEMTGVCSASAAW